MKALALACVLVATPELATLAAAQDALDDAKAQYEAAAYEEALVTLSRATPAALTTRAELEQYRVLCLLALGNIAEAERAVAALVDADPMYVIPPSVASPKVLATIDDMRKRHLPAVARRLLKAGRTAYENKELMHAREQFELLLKILADPAMQSAPGSDDLRELAQGFETLTTAAAAPVVATPDVPPAKVEPTATPAADSSSPVPPAVLVAAVAIDQQLPNWEPPTATVAKFQFAGLLRLRISAEGKVTSATIEKPSHPLYDARLLEVAPTWTFKPATRNGVAIESEKTIAIRLRPVK